METLAQFRTKYPQYHDITDGELAAKLYTKFYSDMPPTQFEKAVGIPTGTISTGTGALGTSEAAQRGILASILGLPGTIQEGINTPFNWAMRKVGLGKYQAGHWPTPSEFESSILPGKTVAALHPTAQSLGEAASVLVPLGGVAGGAAGEAIGAIRGVGKAERALTAAQRAAEAEKSAAIPTMVGKPAYESLQGDELRRVVGGRIKSLELARKSATAPLYDAAQKAKSVADTPNLNPGLKAIWQKTHEESLANADKLYRQLSEPLNDVNSNLSRAFSDRAGNYAPEDFYKTPSATLPSKAFANRDSVRLLEKMAGGDKPWVEAQARVYAASKLDAITEGKDAKAAAIAARKFLRSDWLQEVPGTKKAVEQYVNLLEQNANNVDRAAEALPAAKKARIKAAVYGMAVPTALYFLTREGLGAGYWLRYLERSMYIP